MKSNIIGLKELRANAELYISQVMEGKSFIVVKRSKPVFKMMPPETEEQWETVVDFTKIGKGGVSAKTILKTLHAFNAKS